MTFLPEDRLNGRRPMLPISAPPSLQSVPRRSVIDVFDDAGIASGIARGQREGRFIRLTHNYLRPHYPDALPWGRDIEAYAAKNER